jgi:ankyrin repeat protein
MSAPLRKLVIVDTATRELWSVSESGDVNEVAAILSRGVNINARNEHGMTALMRAARNGHAAVVRTLLEHGADPNIARNDKFTALALAAFFGHTETVF